MPGTVNLESTPYKAWYASSDLESHNRCWFGPSQHRKLMVVTILNHFFPVRRDRDKAVLMVEYWPCFVTKELIDAQNTCLETIMSDHVFVRRLANILGL